LLPGADDDVRGTLVRLDRLEQRVNQAVVAPSPASAPAVPAAPPPRLSEVAPSTAPTTSAATVPTAPAPSATEPQQKSTVVAAGTDDSALPATPAASSSSSAGDTIDIAAARTLWPAVLEKLKLDSRVAWTAFERSAPLGVNGSILTVGVPEAGTLTFAKKSGHDTRLREAMLSVLKVDLTPDLVLDPGVGAVVAAPVDAPSGTTAPAASDEPSVDDPDVDDDSMSGVELAARELGAKVVAEYDES